MLSLDIFPLSVRISPEMSIVHWFHLRFPFSNFADFPVSEIPFLHIVYHPKFRKSATPPVIPEDLLHC